MLEKCIDLDSGSKFVVHTEVFDRLFDFVPPTRSGPLGMKGMRARQEELLFLTGDEGFPPILANRLIRDTISFARKFKAELAVSMPEDVHDYI
jgi:hypothetical protein